MEDVLTPWELFKFYYDMRYNKGENLKERKSLSDD